MGENGCEEGPELAARDHRAPVRHHEVERVAVRPGGDLGRRSAVGRRSLHHREEQLNQPALVAADGRQVDRALDGDGLRGAAERRGGGRRHFAEHGAHVDDLVAHLHGARLDLGQVREVADDAQEPVPGLVDVGHARPLRLVERAVAGPQQQLGKAEHAGQRAADAPGDVGDGAVLVLPQLVIGHLARAARRMAGQGAPRRLDLVLEVRQLGFEEEPRAGRRLDLGRAGVERRAGVLDLGRALANLGVELRALVHPRRRLAVDRRAHGLRPGKVARPLRELEREPVGLGALGAQLGARGLGLLHPLRDREARLPDARDLPQVSGERRGAVGRAARKPGDDETDGEGREAGARQEHPERELRGGLGRRRRTRRTRSHGRTGLVDIAQAHLSHQRPRLAAGVGPCDRDRHLLEPRPGRPGLAPGRRRGLPDLRGIGVRDDLPLRVLHAQVGHVRPGRGPLHQLGESRIVVGDDGAERRARHELGQALDGQRGGRLGRRLPRRRRSCRRGHRGGRDAQHPPARQRHPDAEGGDDRDDREPAEPHGLPPRAERPPLMSELDAEPRGELAVDLVVDVGTSLPVGRRSRGGCRGETMIRRRGLSTAHSPARGAGPRRAIARAPRGWRRFSAPRRADHAGRGVPGPSASRGAPAQRHFALGTAVKMWIARGRSLARPAPPQ